VPGVVENRPVLADRARLWPADYGEVCGLFLFFWVYVSVINFVYGSAAGN
jgi:hypothetical protein